MLFLSRIQAPTFTPEDAAPTVKAIFTQLRAGLTTILHTRVLLGIMLGLGVSMLAIGAVNVLLVPMIVNDLQVPETWFAAVEGAQASSMVLSGALVAALAAKLKPTRIVSSALVVIGVIIAALAPVANVWQLIAVLFAVGWVITPLQAAISTLMQTTVPDQVRGRIGASANTITSTANIISMAAAGVLAGWVGVRTVFLISGAMVVLAGVIAAVIFHGVEVGQPRAGERPQVEPTPAGSD
jgi:MFS family permease